MSTHTEEGVALLADACRRSTGLTIRNSGRPLQYPNSEARCS